MLKVRLRPAARRELRNIWTYSQVTFGTKTAVAYYNGLLDDIDLLRQDPSLGRRFVHRGEVYKYLSNRHFIIYRVDGLRLIVTQILHDRRDVDALV